MQRLIYFVSLFIVIGSCGIPPQKSFTKALAIDSVINTKGVFAASAPLIKQFGVHQALLNDTSFIIYAVRPYGLMLTNLSTWKQRVVSFPDSPFKHSDYEVTLNDSLIYILDITSRRLNTYLLSPERITRISQRNIAGLMRGKNFNQYQQPTFEVAEPYIYVRYRTTEPKNNFLAATACIVGRDNGSGEFTVVDSILHHPKRYRNGKSYYTDSYIKSVDDSLLLYGFSFFDSIYLYNRNSKQFMKKGVLSNVSDFLDYDQSKNMDLAYVRMYSVTNSNNFKFVYNKNTKNILVLRGMKTEKITDTKKIEYFCLNGNLQVMRDSILTHPIHPEFCFAYKQGFLLFTNTLENAYYYRLR